MVATQQQLRQKQLLKPREVSMIQRVQAKREKVFQERQRQATEKIKESQSQRDKLDRLVKNLTKQIRELEVKETKGSMGGALEAASKKYGKQAELSRIKKLQSSIQKGGYYKNLSSLLESARMGGRQTQMGSQAGFATAIKGSKVQSPDIPKGAKIESIKKSIKGNIITYTLPGEVRQPIQEQVMVKAQPSQGDWGIPVQGPQLPPGYVIPTEPKKVPIVQRVFAKKVDDSSLGQIYVTPTEVSRPDVGGRRISVPEETVSVLTPTGVREVATGKTTVADIQTQAIHQRIAEAPIIIPEVYNPRTGTFQAPVYGTGAGGTVYERPPTIQEQRKIQAAIDKEKYFGMTKKQYQAAIDREKEIAKETYRKGVGFVQRVGEEPIVGKVLDMPLKTVAPIQAAIIKKVGEKYYGKEDYDMTIGEAGTLTAKGIEWTAETAAEGWIDIYGTAIKKIPKKHWPGKWIGGTFETKPQRGTQAWADAIDAGKVIPLTKEQFGKGIETAIKGLTYAVPGLGVGYMGSEAFEGVESIRHPEKEAMKIVDEQIKTIKEQRVEAEKTLEPGWELEPEKTTEELTAELLPAAIEQVKFGGAAKAGTSLLFLGTIGAAKAVQWGKTTIVKTLPEGYQFTTKAKNIFAPKKGRYFTFEEIKSKKPTLEVADLEMVGFEEGKGVFYPEQKLMQESVLGRRTIVTEVKRGKPDKVLYEGVPYTDVKGYKEQLKFLKEKIGEKGARDILRYSAPQVPEVSLKEGMIIGKGEQAVGEFLFVKEKPIIIIDESLGIKTRGGKTYFERVYPKRKQIPFKEGSAVFEETSSIITRTPPKKKALDLVGFDFQAGIGISKAAEVEKVGVLRLKPKGGEAVNIFDDYGVRRIETIFFKRNIPLGWDKKLFATKGKTTLIKEIPEEEKVISFKGGEKKSSQEYLTELYSPELVVAPKPTLKISPQKPPKVEVSGKSVLDIKPSESVIISKVVGGEGRVVSEYAGTGLYERTEPSAVFMPSVTKPVVVTPDTGIISDVSAIKPDVSVIGVSGVGLGDKLEPIDRIKDGLDLKMKVGLDSGLEPREKFKDEFDLKMKVGLDSGLEPRERFKDELKFGEELDTKLKIVPRQIPFQEQVPLQRPVPRVKIVPRPRPPTVRPRPKLRPPKIIPKLGVPYKTRVSKPLRKPVPKRGYTFEIRRKGKWERGKVPYAFATKEGAEAFAQKRVLSEAAASYKIVKARKGKKVVRTRRKVSPYRKVLFRKAKKEPGVMVQKKKLRILSEGEKKEISYAGGIAKMKKAKTSFLKQQAGKKQPIKKKTKKKVTKKKKGGKK